MEEWKEGLIILKRQFNCRHKYECEGTAKKKGVSKGQEMNCARSHVQQVKHGLKQQTIRTKVARHKAKGDLGLGLFFYFTKHKMRREKAVSRWHLAYHSHLNKKAANVDANTRVSTQDDRRMPPKIGKAIRQSGYLMCVFPLLRYKWCSLRS